jgi:phosphomevalonate kinase
MHQLTLIHNMSQLVHCVAQGKIGSGFDVSAAVFGSQIYRQFPKEALSSFIELPLVAQRDQLTTLLAVLTTSHQVANHIPFIIPPGLDLVLGDVDAGADTVSMVKQVQSWARDYPQQSARLFNELQQINQKFISSLNELSLLHEYDTQNYAKQLSTAAKQTYNEWNRNIESSSLYRLLCQVRHNFEHIRSLLRELGTLAKVPIEPPQQTALLDQTINLPGVVCAGVPGAGGYDAIFALCIAESVSNVHMFWTQWKEMSVCTLLTRVDNRGIELGPYLYHLSTQS